MTGAVQNGSVVDNGTALVVVVVVVVVEAVPWLGGLDNVTDTTFAAGLDDGPAGGLGLLKNEPGAALGVAATGAGGLEDTGMVVAVDDAAEGCLNELAREGCGGDTSSGDGGSTLAAAARRVAVAAAAAAAAVASAGGDKDGDGDVPSSLLAESGGADTPVDGADVGVLERLGDDGHVAHVGDVAA